MTSAIEGRDVPEVRAGDVEHGSVRRQEQVVHETVSVRRLEMVQKLSPFDDGVRDGAHEVRVDVGHDLVQIRDHVDGDEGLVGRRVHDAHRARDAVADEQHVSDRVRGRGATSRGHRRIGAACTDRRAGAIHRRARRSSARTARSAAAHGVIPGCHRSGRGRARYRAREHMDTERPLTGTTLRVLHCVET
jgi:hypothetical protein